MITCQLATIPERIELVKQTIESLMPQVDRLNVMCNNYTDQHQDNLFHWAKDIEKIRGIDFFDGLFVYRRDNRMTDGEKYYNIENAEPGYIFICDDDIRYPDTYCQDMIAKIEENKRKYVVSLHGRIFTDFPIKYYFGNKGNQIAYNCLQGFEGDHVICDEETVGVCGDGVSAWHTDTLKMRYEYVEQPNMSQIWLALTCNRFNVPQKAIGHRADYLMYLWPEGLKTHQTLWESQNADAYEQTDLINSRWIIRK